MNLTIDVKSPLPVYQQIIQAIKLKILSGALREDMVKDHNLIIDASLLKMFFFDSQIARKAKVKMSRVYFLKHGWMIRSLE